MAFGTLWSTVLTSYRIMGHCYWGEIKDSCGYRVYSGREGGGEDINFWLSLQFNGY